MKNTNTLHKLTYLIIIMLLLTFFNVSTTKAQGTYTCKWNGGKCKVVANCTPGYEPDTTRCTKNNFYGSCTLRFDNEPCLPIATTGSPTSTTTAGPSGPISLSALEAAAPNFSFKNKGLGDVINSLITDYLFVIVGGLLLLYLISGSLQLMTSGGDPKAAQAAKTKVTNALIGFVLVFSAYWITTLLGNILGLNGFGGIF